jgi:hypothetical protein
MTHVLGSKSRKPSQRSVDGHGNTQDSAVNRRFRACFRRRFGAISGFLEWLQDLKGYLFALELYNWDVIEWRALVPGL